MKVQLISKSGNAKTGPIPVSYSDRSTCPRSCPFLGNGCYAEGWPLRDHWDKVPERGVSWARFCSQVSELPSGQLWRHNGAGDLPRRGRTIDALKLARLVAANAGKRGFTYTHHALTPANRAALSDANLRGFTVNVSCESLEQVDNIGLALPTVVVLPSLAKGEREPKVTRTPAGIRVVSCPAQYRDTSCAECKLCADSQRTYAIGFRAHGIGTKKVAAVIAAARLNRKNRHEST